VKARLINDGDTAEITVKFQKGGELTNLKHCLVQFQDVPTFSTDHPLYLAMAQIHRFHVESKESILTVHLPFRCDPQGFFYDPINDQQNDLDLGIFPLTNSEEQASSFPPPSTRFLHVMCEELVKATVKQKTKTRSYFSPPRPPASPDDAGNEEMLSAALFP
jgi:hypothetical protein